jgi:hypothetical protein
MIMNHFETMNTHSGYALVGQRHILGKYKLEAQASESLKSKSTRLRFELVLSAFHAETGAVHLASPRPFGGAGRRRGGIVMPRLCRRESSSCKMAQTRVAPSGSDLTNIIVRRR